MADYDPDWGRRMQQRYGVSEADLSDPETRAYLTRRSRKDSNAQAVNQQPQPPAAPGAPTTSTPQTDPAPKGGAGLCADGSAPRPVNCVQPPCPSVCPDGSSPGGSKAGGDPRYPAPPGGGYGGYPGPYGMPPPAAGFGYAVYGGPGTQQPGRGGPAAGHQGGANYPQMGNTYPLYGTGARPGAQPGYPGAPPGGLPNYGYPNMYPQGPYGANVAADALERRRV